MAFYDVGKCREALILEYFGASEKDEQITLGFVDSFVSLPFLSIMQKMETGGAFVFCVIGRPVFFPACFLFAC